MINLLRSKTQPRNVKWKIMDMLNVVLVFPIVAVVLVRDDLIVNVSWICSHSLKAWQRSFHHLSKMSELFGLFHFWEFLYYLLSLPSKVLSYKYGRIFEFLLWPVHSVLYFPVFQFASDLNDSSAIWFFYDMGPGDVIFWHVNI